MKIIKSKRIVKISVNFKTNHNGVIYGELLKIIKNNETNNELESISDELHKPILIKDDYFQELLLNKYLNTMETTINFCNKNIDLRLELDKKESHEKSKQHAKEIFENQEKWENFINEFAVKKLLKLKNESWLDENEITVSADEFINRMELESIIIYPNGKFEFHHNDGELFWGHYISISGNVKKGPKEASIPG